RIPAAIRPRVAALAARAAGRHHHVITESEREAYTELHFARALGAEDASEVRAAEDPVGQVEVGTVEDVEDLPPELELRGTDCPRLGKSEVDVGVPRSDDAVARRTSVRERRLQRKGRRVEPAFHRPVAVRQVRIAELVGTLCGTCTD